jgi:hypothetical protein
MPNNPTQTPPLSAPLNYLIPPANSDAKAKLAVIDRLLSQGEAFIRSQRAFDDMEQAIEVIAGTRAKRPAKLSQLHLNRIKRQIREVVGSLSNLKPLWGYKSDNPLYDRHVEIINKLILAWWHYQFVDRSIREALQYAAVLGTGYITMGWDKDLWFTGRGDIKLTAHGPKDILPVGLPADNDLNKAYAVIIRTEVPLSQAVAMYPEHAPYLVPDRDGPSWFAKAKEKVQRFASPVLNFASTITAAGTEIFPTIDIFNIYVRDTSVNYSGADIPMGDPGTNWAYKVPWVGKQVPTGTLKPDGTPQMHEIGPDEALMYPRLRLITCTRTHVIKDGPSPWWHGRIPVVQFRLDDWPWDFLGYSLARDTISINDAVNSLYRSVVDSANVRLRPPVWFDRDVVGKGMIDRFDPRQPGSKLEMNSSAGVQEPIKPIFDPSQFDVPQWIPEVIQGLEERSDYFVGVQDLTALAKARQTPSADSVEKLMEIAGPLVYDMSRNMERSLRDLGELFKSMVFQFYTAARKVQVLGPDGLTEEDFDFDPDLMIPSHLPWESPDDGPSQYNRIKRAEWHQNNFVMHIVPNSLHQVTQMTRKLLFLQLQRSGVPIDPWTLAEVFDIPNFGRPPDGANTVVERWEAWQRIVAEIQVSIQMQTMQMAAMGSPQGQAMMALGQMGQAMGAEQGGNAGHPGPGRPPTGQSPPEFQIKNNGDGSQRTTISESGDGGG